MLRKPKMKITAAILAAALVLGALVTALVLIGKPGPYAETYALCDSGYQALNSVKSLQGTLNATLTLTKAGESVVQKEYSSFSRVLRSEDDMDMEAHFERQSGFADVRELSGVWYDDGTMYYETVFEDAITRYKQAAAARDALAYLDMRPAFTAKDVTDAQEEVDIEGSTTITMLLREKAAKKILYERKAGLYYEGKSIEISHAECVVLLDEGGMLMSMAFYAVGTMTTDTVTMELAYHSEYSRTAVNMIEAIDFPERIYAFEEQ